MISSKTLLVGLLQKSYDTIDRTCQTCCSNTSEYISFGYIYYMQVAETRMHWYQVSRKDRIRNEYISESFGVVGIKDMWGEYRLWWFGQGPHDEVG